MVRRLICDKPYPEVIIIYYQLQPWERTSMKLESNYEKIIEENALENVAWKILHFVKGTWS